MLIGIDFDNTIVCYDQLFFDVAREQALIPADLQVSKDAVRNHLRATGREQSWIELQGAVYGSHMLNAKPFPEFFEFIRHARALNVKLAIVSHKTRYPFSGPRYDLHQAARNWIESQNLHGLAGHSLSAEAVFFELTKNDKIARIKALGCTHFIDDLPEILREIASDITPERILFDPAKHHQELDVFTRVSSWSEITAMFLSGAS